MAAVTIPPWLNRPDYIAAMQAGNAAGVAGAQTGLEGLKIAENARQANMQDTLARDQLVARRAEAEARTQLEAQDLAIRQQIAQQTQARNQIESDIARAKDEALIGIKRSELDLDKRKLDDIATATARKYQGQQDYELELRSRVAKGEPYEEAAMKAALLHGHKMSMTGGESSALIRRNEPPRPAPVHYSKAVYEAGNPEGIDPGTYNLGTDNSLQRIGPLPTAKKALAPHPSVEARMVRQREMAALVKANPWLLTGEPPSAWTSKGKAAYQAILDHYNELKGEVDQKLGGDEAPESTEAEVPAASTSKRLRWTPQGFQPIQ